MSGADVESMATRRYRRGKYVAARERACFPPLSSPAARSKANRTRPRSKFGLVQRTVSDTITHCKCPATSAGKNAIREIPVEGRQVGTDSYDRDNHQNDRHTLLMNEPKPGRPPVKRRDFLRIAGRRHARMGEREQGVTWQRVQGDEETPHPSGKRGNTRNALGEFCQPDM